MTLKGTNRAVATMAALNAMAVNEATLRAWMAHKNLSVRVIAERELARRRAMAV